MYARGPLLTFSRVFSEDIYSVVIFASLGSNLLDASYQVSLPASELNDRLTQGGIFGYTILDSFAVKDARNLRYSFTLQVEGFVAEQDLVEFEKSLQQVWRTVRSGIKEE